RPLEIARDVDRERLQRRDVERVQPALAAEITAGGDETALRICLTSSAASVVANPVINEFGGRRHRVPSPLEGEGQGGEYRQVLNLWPPPSPPLPLKGGGSRLSSRR